MVEFFPSLKDRYKDKCLSTEKYKTLLRKIGFSNFEPKQLFYAQTKEDAQNEKDVGIRIGQHVPELYLEPEKRKVIPAFKEMRSSELEEGLGKLKKAIDDGTIHEKIKRYEQKARMKGDIGIIIATR